MVELKEPLTRYHGILDFCRSQPFAANIDDVIHPSRDSIVSVLVAQGSVASKIKTYRQRENQGAS